MVFSSPAWVPSLDQSAPDQTTVGDFVLSNHVTPKKDAPFVDAISGHIYTMEMLKSRVDSLARGLAKDLDWSPNVGSPWDKVVAIYSLNTTDYFLLCWAIHRLNGILVPLDDSDEKKLAMLTHYGLITNLLQMVAFEGFADDSRGQTVAAAIPFSHSYGILIGHLGVLRAEQHIVFPRFDMQLMLGSVPTHQVNRLYLVPPILAALAANSFLMEPFDLSSVSSVVTGAAALDPTVAGRLKLLQPRWEFLHAWGTVPDFYLLLCLTETSIVVTLTSMHDVWYGSSGSLLPGCLLRLVDANGKDVETYGESGEVYYKAPNMFLGYLGDQESTGEAFDDDGWLRTGDMGAIQVSPNGLEHLFIRDRIKDMIKVKGMQVVPADVETVLMTHPAVADVAVIGVPDELAGERAMAFVVRSASIMTDLSADDLQESINDHVESKLHETHWLGDRIELVAEIPKSQSGKILKKLLRAQVASV
ncbi:putative 4-coumarate--CoA ligase 2 [Beauveria bassiana D1-5]|uniref:Putative 4-coumarate--CoA ligase 2 n=1 Tax=Beauveria bassiana D1-5 TaxID=1245745 RepID=A0A0A2VG59_BEABA|nr:putative 4-coumarate--CoA ligase 2 [Beauveria bassiana D1-5]